MSSLKELQALGGFVPDKPVKKEIKFSLDSEDELSAVIHVKKLSVGEYEAMFMSGEEGRSKSARVISDTISLGPDGKERLTFEQAYKLHPRLAAAMFDAFKEVNLAKKPSAPATDSSAT